VEKVSGQSYADYVTHYILEPLDMRHSYASRVPALADGLAEGHYYMFGHAFRWELALPPAHFPAGFLIASVEDMTHYAIAQLNDGRYGDTAILSAHGMTELHAPAIPTGGGAHYAMGWEVGTLDGMRFIAHEGANTTFRSNIYLLPEQGWGVILLANAHGFEQFLQLTEVAKGVLNMLNGKASTPVTLPFNLRFLYWTIVLMPLLQIIGIAYGWRYWRNKGVGHILLTVILYGTVALLGLFGVPQLTGVPIWSGMRIIYPELGYGLIVGATLGIGWSVIYTAMSLRIRGAK